MRGEYREYWITDRDHGELPPRARRIHGALWRPHHDHGTTSACAENTISHVAKSQVVRNYLRVRGEYPYRCRGSPCIGELPPRARRIQNFLKKTFKKHVNYLRVRGEYHGCGLWRLVVGELPPRARRILPHTLPASHQHGTTSACAENTDATHVAVVCVWNYLRVRGEYLLLVYMIEDGVELPPRARRILDSTAIFDGGSGTTSACAENTPAQNPARTHQWNYLRVRGEYPK